MAATEIGSTDDVTIIDATSTAITDSSPTITTNQSITNDPIIDVTNKPSASSATSPNLVAEDQSKLARTTSNEKSQPSIDSAPINKENLIPSLSSWEWVIIDGLKLPAVTRNAERYVAVHMVQLKLLSKFPSDVPSHIIKRFTMDSHKMTLNEAWTFNSINTILRKFDLGCQLFSANDELVKLNDVQMFYWNVKLINLERIKLEYEKAIQMADNHLQLIATIETLKRNVENDIQVVIKELNIREKKHSSNPFINQEESKIFSQN